MDNEHRKLFVIKQSKGCKFMNKMQQNTLGGRAPPGPAEGAYVLPVSPVHNGGGLLLRVREGRGGAYFYGDGK